MIQWLQSDSIYDVGRIRPLPFDIVVSLAAIMVEITLLFGVPRGPSDVVVSIVLSMVR